MLAEIATIKCHDLTFMRIQWWWWLLECWQFQIRKIRKNQVTTPWCSPIQHPPNFRHLLFRYIRLQKIFKRVKLLSSHHKQSNMPNKLTLIAWLITGTDISQCNRRSDSQLVDLGLCTSVAHSSVIKTLCTLSELQQQTRCILWTYPLCSK